jgi:uncharacterized protein YjiS (DUF1127 family)
MEMVMSTIFYTPAPAQGNVSHSQVTGPVAFLKRWWVAYITWRMEAAAIARLGAMSNRELKDIDLVRSNIVAAVRGKTSD